MGGTPRETIIACAKHEYSGWLRSSRKPGMKKGRLVAGGGRSYLKKV